MIEMPLTKGIIKDSVRVREYEEIEDENSDCNRCKAAIY